MFKPVCPTRTACFAAGSETVEIKAEPFVRAYWHQDTPLAEVNAQLPPWLALTIETYAQREPAFITTDRTGKHVWWYRGCVTLIALPPSPGEHWRYQQPAGTEKPTEKPTMQQVAL